MRILTLLFLSVLALFGQQPEPHQGMLYYDWDKPGYAWARLGDGVSFVVEPATGEVTLEVEAGFLDARVASLESVVAQLQNQAAQQAAQITAQQAAISALTARVAALEANQIPPPAQPIAAIPPTGPSVSLQTGSNLELFLAPWCSGAKPCQVARWNFAETYLSGCRVALPNPADPNLNTDLLIVAERTGFAIHDLDQTVMDRLVVERWENGAKVPNSTANCLVKGTYAGGPMNDSPLNNAPLYLIKVRDGQIEEYGEWHVAPNYWARIRVAP